MRSGLKSALQVIDILTANGWEGDGATPTQSVRLSTARAPVYGGIGGEVRTFGGRERFHKPGTNLFVTVGSRTVSFYHRENGEALGFRTYSTTKDIDYITHASAKNATRDMPLTPADIVAQEREQHRREQCERETAEAQAQRQARLKAGERILVMSGTKGRLYERKAGYVVINNEDAEQPVCCFRRGRWLIQHFHRNHAIGSPDEHDDDCPNKLGKLAGHK